MRIQPSDISAVVVTRGNVSLEPILDSFTAAGIFDFVVYDNSRRPDDLGVFGRYAALPECGRDVVLVQDDDVILPVETIEALAAAYEPGRIVANMPERFRAFYSDSCLVGFGAVFERDLPDRAFDRFRRCYLTDAQFHADTYIAARGNPAAMFNRRPDVVFTALTESTWLDLPYTEREFATGADRAYRQKGHTLERQRVLQMARKARQAVIR